MTGNVVRYCYCDINQINKLAKASLLQSSGQGVSLKQAAGF